MSNIEKLPWAIQGYYSNYFKFSGRANKAEFWWAFVLFGPFTTIFLSMINSSPGPYKNNIFISLLILSMCIPNLSVKARRLHDAGKSAWNILWDFTIVGGLYVLYLLSQPSQPGANRFGEVVEEPAVSGEVTSR
jgi:uncharacterized membrane protein YhaH (DUF805 family)